MSVEVRLFHTMNGVGSMLIWTIAHNFTVHANTMLAVLNARQSLRQQLQKDISLEHMDTSTASVSARDNILNV